jgi:tetratricopeptide (TPR) repeat protein
MALLATGDSKTARLVLTAAMDEPGQEPDTASLLLMRARAAEVEGDLSAAIRDLLTSARAAEAFLPEVPRRVHSLLDHVDDADSRRFLLSEWAPKASSAGLPTRTIGLLCLHAAVLEADWGQASDALLHGLGTLAPPGEFGGLPGADAVSSLLSEISDHPALGGPQLLVLCQLLRLVPDTPAALAAADRAIAAGFPDTPGDALSKAHEMRADLLADLGQPDEARQAYYDAGYDRYRSNDHDHAIPLLRKAVKDIARWSNAYGYLADSLRLRAWSSGQVEPSQLRDAVAALDEGLALPRLSGAPSWIYVLRGLLARDLADAGEPAERHSQLFTSVIALEEAVAVDGSQPDNWAWLASAHSKLMNNAAALQALDSTPDGEEQSVDALFEAAWVALMAAAPDAASRIKQFADHPMADDAGAGMLMLYSRKPRPAQKRLERASLQSPDSIVVWWLLGRARAQTRDAHTACECFAKVRAIYAMQDPRESRYSDILAAADSCYRMGDNPAAARMLDMLRSRSDVPPTSAADIHKMSTMIRLASGDPEGARLALHQALSPPTVPWDIYDLARDLTDLARRLTSDGSREADARLATSMAARARYTARRRQNSLRGNDAAPAELHKSLQRWADDGNAIAACNATIARLAVWLDRPQDAAAAALEVLRHHPRSPAGAARLIAGIDTLIRAGQPQVVRPLLATALRSLSPDDVQLAGDVRTRDALAAALTGALIDAEQTLARALEAENLGDAVETTVVSTWTSLLGDPAGYWRVRQTADQDGQVARIADQCLAAMLRLDESDDEAAVWPVTTPIQLDLADDLVPPDTTSDGPMLGVYIPLMRRRVTAAITGPLPDGSQNWLPGVRVRWDPSLGEGQFRIALSELPQAPSRIPTGMVFCLAASDRVRAAIGDEPTLIPALDPVTRHEATWVPVAYANELTASGLEVWRDPLLCVFRELERQILHHLSDFLSIDEVKQLLDTWARGRGESADTDGDHVPIERLTAVVRALVRERTPVRDGATLLRAVSSTQAIEEAVDAYRQAIMAALPGNEEDTIRIMVPPKLAALASRSATAGAAEETVQFAALAEVRQLLGRQPARVALVAAGSVARRSVCGYLRPEFPDVPVLSDVEAAPMPTTPEPAAARQETVEGQ